MLLNTIFKKSKKMDFPDPQNALGTPWLQFKRKMTHFLKGKKKLLKFKFVFKIISVNFEG